MQNTHLILAKKILNTMSALNVKEFNQMYANRSKDELIQFMIETIDGLLEEEIQYGISRLCKEQKLVNFGGFRKLCESPGVWQSPIEAWEDVLNYEKNIIHKIQLVTYEVMERVKTIHNQEYLYIARSTFMDLYAKAVEKQRSSYLYPKYWERPVNSKKRISIDTSHNRVSMPDKVREDLAAILKKSCR